MEHWVKILLGTFFGSIFTITFYFIFDYFFQKYRDSLDQRNNNSNPDGSGSGADIPILIRNRNHGNSEEIERLIYEEYEGAESVGVIHYNLETNSMSGIYICPEELKVEYFLVDLPECCTERDPENASWRSVMSAISVWSKSWQFNDSVNFLIQDTKIVKEVSAEGTLKHRQVQQISNKYDFKIFIQWSDNFLCDNVSHIDLWESAILVVKGLLKNGDCESVWKNAEFPCLHWNKHQINIDLEHFHRLPHSGEITPPSAVRSDEKPLIDI